MKTRILALPFICIIFIACHGTQHNKTGTESPALVKYDEYTLNNSYISESDTYNVQLSVLNHSEKAVKYNNGTYSDRALLIVMNNKAKGIFEIKIEKEKLVSKDQDIDLSEYLIYNVSFGESCDSLYLFCVEVNLCIPESDNCHYFRISFNQEGEYSVIEDEIEEEGE